MQYYMAVSYPPTAVLYRNTRKHGSIKSFLSKRSFQVKIASSTSSSYPHIEGIPQGSVLSTTLFLIAVNNFISVLPPGTQSSLYIDDIIIYASSPSIHTLQQLLQSAISSASLQAVTTFPQSSSKSSFLTFYIY